MAQTNKHAQTGGNKAVFDALVKKGVSPAKAKETAQKFRRNANKTKGS